MELNYDYCLLYSINHDVTDSVIEFHMLARDKSTKRYSEIKSDWSVSTFDSPNTDFWNLIELADAKLTTDKFVKLIIEGYNYNVKKCDEFSVISPKFRINKDKGKFSINFVKIHVGDMTMRTYSSSIPDKDEIEETHVSMKKLIESLQLHVNEIITTVEDNYKFISEVRSQIDENKTLDRDVDFIIMT